jgi:hypothetical protein
MNSSPAPLPVPPSIDPAEIGLGARTNPGGGAAAVDIVIDASNNSRAGLRDAINRAGAGVTATIVSNAGAAADADLSVDGIAVQRASNSIDDLVDGTRIRLVKADPAATTVISASRDGAQLSATIGDFATTLGAMRSLIGDFRKGATGTDAAGALANDATVGAMDQRIAALVTAPVAEANGLRLRDLGVNITRAGDISFDATRFAALSSTRCGDAEALLLSLAAPALSDPPQPPAIDRGTGNARQRRVQPATDGRDGGACQGRYPAGDVSHPADPAICRDGPACCRIKGGGHPTGSAARGVEQPRQPVGGGGAGYAANAAAGIGCRDIVRD